MLYGLLRRAGLRGGDRAACVVRQPHRLLAHDRPRHHAEEARGDELPHRAHAAPPQPEGEQLLLDQGARAACDQHLGRATGRRQLQRPTYGACRGLPHSVASKFKERGSRSRGAEAGRARGCEVHMPTTFPAPSALPLAIVWTPCERLPHSCELEHAEVRPRRKRKAPLKRPPGLVPGTGLGRLWRLHAVCALHAGSVISRT